MALQNRPQLFLLPDQVDQVDLESPGDQERQERRSFRLFHPCRVGLPCRLTLHVPTHRRYSKLEIPDLLDRLPECDPRYRNL